jgi:hypothetical protein
MMIRYTPFQGWFGRPLREIARADVHEYSGKVTRYVPTGCAHGYQALADTADVSYMIDRVHDPTEDVSAAFDDPDLAIPWPQPVTIISTRDRLAAPQAYAARLLVWHSLAGSVHQQCLD